MNDSLTSPADLSSITSSLKIDEAIQRSRKVMEESKALTYRNSQKKSMIDEKLKSVLNLNTEAESFRLNETSRAYLEAADTPKVVFSGVRDDFHSEIRNLNNKISSQATQLKLLEMNISELRIENQQLLDENRGLKHSHKQEIQYLTEMYEEKLKETGGNKELSGTEKRLRDLEENFRRHINYSCKLEERINEISLANQESQKTKILEIEKEYKKNKEKITEFENKLEKAKKILDNNETQKPLDGKKAKKSSKEKLKKSKKKSLKDN